MTSLIMAVLFGGESPELTNRRMTIKIDTSSTVAAISATDIENAGRAGDLDALQRRA